MDISLKEKFSELWKKYFDGAELPITFYYGDDPAGAAIAKPAKGHSCLICELGQVRQGKSLAYDEPAAVCGGAKRYLGFTDSLRPGFEYFLSCGIPGKMEGERYKKSPEIVREMLKHQRKLNIPGKFIIFKRWDNLAEQDRPDVIVFFAPPDVLSGLFTLSSFAEVEPVRVVAPFAAGCGSIIHYPFLEKDEENPRGFIGMFDPSARPCVAANELTFAVPMKKFARMVADMEQSFLVTPTWDAVLKRIKKFKKWI